jgi:hypothetical protein
VDALSRTILKMEENLKHQEETQEPRDRVEAMFKRYKKLFSSARETIGIIKNNVEALDKAIDLRLRGYKTLLRMTAKHVNRYLISVISCLF